jgi:hypothetical protein
MAWQAFLAAANLGIGLIKAGEMRRTADEQRRADELQAFNNDTDAVRSDAEARQRHNDRAEQYRANVSANIAAFSASGRDVYDSPSINDFFNRQKEVVSKDLRVSDFMGAAESAKVRAQSAVIRQEAGARKNAAYFTAFTSTVGAISDYSKTKVKV